MSGTLHCVWCSFYILVGDRGMRGGDMGAGVEAAELMKRHISDKHDKSWAEFIASERGS